MSLMLVTGLTVISAANASPSSWTCNYLAERLPRALLLRGEDALSAEETRAARKRLALADAVLTRASGLALARSVGATRLVMARCLDERGGVTIEAQSFEVEQPVSGDPLRVRQTLSNLPSAIDQVARHLTPGAFGPDASSFRAPSSRALAMAGAALTNQNAGDRARGLRLALNEDRGSLDLRLSAVEALIAARDFDAAVEVAGSVPAQSGPPALARLLAFEAAAALLEAGRYAEASVALEGLRREKETGAVLNNLGVAQFRMRDPQASSYFERASFSTDLRQQDVAFNRSLALIFENKADKALPMLDAALRVPAPDVRSRLLKVWALALLKRDAERSEEWNRLLAAAPSFALLGAPDLARRLERIFLFEQHP